MKYENFINNKKIVDCGIGFEPVDLNSNLFDFQKDITTWACRRGRAALFEGCGLGKTIQQLAWADQVHKHTGGNVLILAPLAVSKQTKAEGRKFRIRVNIATNNNNVKKGINITNYEKLHNFDPSLFVGVVADESGIMKSFSGKIKKQMCDMWASTKYKLSCTATPSPNDFEELGNQAEFLGICTRSEMLSMFFINDTANTGTWRLKKHAEGKFWQWICSWAIMIQKPADLGYENKGFDLPALTYNSHVVKSNKSTKGSFFVTEAKTLTERRSARRDSLEDRCKIAANLVNSSDEEWVVWCDMNAESKLLTELINNAVEVTGSDDIEHKENSMVNFSKGNIKALVSKPKIAGWGMNWQNCHNMVFVGLSDSFEALYQAVRRCYRFGQEHNVNVHIITHETEGAVVRNIRKKEKRFEEMNAGMTANMSDITKKGLISMFNDKSEYITDVKEGKRWKIYNEDCVDVAKRIESDSIHYSIYSPPFASLFVYSNSDRDMGNCKGSREFFEHFEYLAAEMYRVLMPGRLMSFHCMNLPATISHDGYIGIKDFRGDLIRLFEKMGFIFHSEVVIWKDPLVQATRTKVLTLAHKQISKDSSRCAQGLPDYVITMRKPGDNPEPVSKGRGFEEYIGALNEPDSKKTNDARTNKYSHHVWQRYASPVWFDIRQTRTLNEKLAREKDDERHMCPLQLDVIDRCLDLWTNPDDLIFSPFTGIGSEGWCSINMGRRFIGAELKKSYFDVAVKNLKGASGPKQKAIFDE